MTPDERNLLQGFLQDLAQTRGALKDAEADAMINTALRANPDAAYVLVQHAILADQALHAAQGQIAELQAQLRNTAPPPQPTSFLGGGPSPWARAAQPQYAPPQPQYAPPPQQGGFGGGPFSPGGGLGSFLRNAGTTAAGVAGGAFLFEGLSGLFGGHGGYGGGFGGGFGQPVENVTINEYGGGDNDDDGGGYDDGGYDDGGSSDY